MKCNNCGATQNGTKCSYCNYIFDTEESYVQVTVATDEELKECGVWDFKNNTRLKAKNVTELKRKMKKFHIWPFF